MANGKEKSIKWLPLKYKSNTFIVSFFDMHILIKERKATHSKGYLHTHVQCKYTLTYIRLYTDLDMCKNIFMWNVTCANYPEMVGGVKWKEFIWDFPLFSFASFFSFCDYFIFMKWFMTNKICCFFLGKYNSYKK